MKVSISGFALCGVLLPVSHAWGGTAMPINALAGADATFHGTVQGIQQCASPNDESVWSFVTFQVHDEMVGDVVAAPGQPANTYTVRFPYGTHADGTHSAFVGTPHFNVGDSFIVGVHAASDGVPDLLPTFLRGPGAFLRTFQDANGSFATAPDGTLIQQSPNTGLPIVGTTQAIPADRNWPASAPLVTADVLAAAASYRTSVGYDGSQVPARVWRGRLRASTEATVTLTGGAQYDLSDFDCIADLKGTYSGASLLLTGTCTAPYVGKLDVTVTGTYNSVDGWSGNLGIRAAYDNDIGAMFTWDDTPWSSPLDYKDNFSAHTTDALPTNSVPEEYLDDFTISEHPKRMVSFVAGWDGRRPLMPIGDLKQWIVDMAAAESHFGRQVYSQEISTSTCDNYAIDLVGQ